MGGTPADRTSFKHALKIMTDVCIGCAHCMRVCPTEALRVRQGKARLQNNRCIDCGECFTVCPSGAIVIEQDDFEGIFAYKHRVALIPSVIMGQFPEDVSPDMICKALISIGFTRIIQVEDSVEYLVPQVRAYVENAAHEKPVISSYCPAIVRLIQVKFPSLVGNLMLLRQPLDLTTAYVKQELMKAGAMEHEIGVFYITPCAAKIAAVKSPVGEERSEVTGVLNMDYIYNRILREIRHKDIDPDMQVKYKPLSARSLNWSLTSGEASEVPGSCLAIDGISNVIEFLEKIENDEITGVDFLELRSCDQSCAGGALTAGNRFLTVEHLRKEAVALTAKKMVSEKIMQDYRTANVGKIALKRVEPRSMLKLDEDMATAMKKMERVNRIMCHLPGVDCGVCGAPSCTALAEDIVQGEAAISQCVFLQKNMEQNKLAPGHAFKIMKQVWGEDRFKKNCRKPYKLK